MSRPFIVYALPRCRTFWLSRFLSFGAGKCGHDELRHLRGLDDIKSLLDMPFYGSVETAAAPWWRLVHTMRPDIKTAVVRRHVAEVVESLIATGVQFDRLKLIDGMRRLDAKLDQIVARVPGVLSVNFKDLNDERVCARLFEHCTGESLKSDWFNFVSPLRMSCDLEAAVRYFQAHLPQLERVGQSAKQRILAKLSSRRVLSDAMTFQQEPFEVFLRDAQELFAQHLVEVGERPDAWATKNLDLMRALEQLGALHVTTARCNGRMFGYLMSVIAPALDSAQGRDGVHTTFYVSPDSPGIGLKLQRASVEFLRSKGVDQVSFRAGTRGSADRLSVLYKRLGAEDAGRMYTLDLKDVA